MADDPMCPACRHPKRQHDKHGRGAAGGECVCHLTEVDFAAATPSPAVEELAQALGFTDAAEVVAVAAGAETLPAAQPLEPVEVPEALARRALMWWDSWYCAFCYSRYFTPRLCCGRQAEPVRVLVVPREVS